MVGVLRVRCGDLRNRACNRTYDMGARRLGREHQHMGASTCTPCSTCGTLESEACTPANNTVCETRSCADDEVVDATLFSSDVKCKLSPFGGLPKNAEEAADRAFFQGLVFTWPSRHDPSLMTVCIPRPT